MSKASRLSESLADASGIFRVQAMFRREFGLLPALVRDLRPGDMDRVGIVADHIDLMIAILEEHHYGEEEGIWPRLLERGPADAMAIVYLMQSHHRIVEEMTGEIQVALRTWYACAGLQGGIPLAEALDRMIPLLHEHMSLEESLIVPLIERYIYAVEWDEAIQKGRARLPAEWRPLLLGMVMYETYEPLRDSDGTLAEAARAFAIHSQRVHGTETPPLSENLIANSQQ